MGAAVGRKCQKAMEGEELLTTAPRRTIGPLEASRLRRGPANRAEVSR